MGLKIAKNMTLPDDAVTQTFALLARRGAGKTYAASVLAEEMLKQGNQIVWIDPMGVAWGLRSEYPVLILGGEHADVPLEPTAGKFVANFIVSDNVSAILDIGLFGEGEMRRFVADFAKEFYKKNRDPVHLFVDEADEFAPQSGMRDAAQCLGAMQNVVRRGRQRGIGVTLITQRSAALSKSVLTQTECLIAMQTTGPHDLKAIRDWLEYHASTEEKNEIMQSLSRMQQGEAYVYSPGWLKTLKRIQFRKRETFDSSATPKPGQKKKPPKKMAEIDIESLKGQMAETIEKAKANDPTELKKEVARLKRELAKKPAAEVDQSQMDRGIEQALKQRDRDWKQQVSELQTASKKMVDRLEKISKIAHLNGEVPKNVGVPVGDISTVQPRTRPQPKPVRQPAARVPSGSGDGVSLSKGENIILIAVAQYDGGATREQLTILTGYKRSTRDAYLQRLREKGFVEIGDVITATETGVEALGSDYEPLPQGDELRTYWLNRLPEGERKVLEIAIESWPNEIDRDSISDQTEYQRSTRDAYIQRLKSRQLISVGRGTVRAKETLFD